MMNNLFKKFLTYSYGSVVGAAIAFITTMVTTRILSPEEFGKSSMYLLFVNLAMIVAVFGTDQAFVRFFYEEKENKRGALLYNCLKISLIILLPMTIIVVIIRKQLSEFLFSDYNLLVFLALILSVGVHVLYRFGTLVIRMQQKGNLFSILEILNKTLILVGLVGFYSLLGNSYEVLIYSSALTFIILLIFLFYSQKEFWSLSNLTLSNQYHSKSEIFNYSYPLIFTTTIMWVFEGVDKFAIRQWANFNDLGLYTAAFKIIGLLTIIQTAFTTFWTPVAYETYQKDPNNTTLYSKVSKLISFLMMLVGVIVIMMKDIIIMLLGGEYEESGLMLSFLIFVPIMYTISETTVIGINFNKKVKLHIIIAITACVVNFIGNWFLVPIYGGIGASISTGVSYILFFALRTFWSLRYYKVNYGLAKVYTSTIVLVFLASYTLLPTQPIHEQIVGVIAMILTLLIYSKDLAGLRKLTSKLKGRTN